MFDKLLEAINSEESMRDASYQEKVDFFYARTDKHRQLVADAARKIVDAYPEFTPLITIVKDHDKSKYKEPELTPYIELTWNKRYNIESSPDDLLAIQRATLHHVTTCAHHPEYHLKNKAHANVNLKNRDKSDKCVDVMLMDKLSIAEMVADWVAMSTELQKNTPRQWYNQVRDVRWHFSKSQQALIDKLLKVFEHDVKDNK